MNVQQRKHAFVKLGEYLAGMPEDTFLQWASEAEYKNMWFSKASVKAALKGIAYMLQASAIEEFVTKYTIPDQLAQVKRVAVIMAGNLPLVGFHDLFCVLLAGHHALIKCSSQDEALPKRILNKLVELAPEMKNQFTITDRISQPDAAIATGSDNTSRYFTYYFSSIPHIIRKNRVSVAVLNDKETPEDLDKLTDDIMQYYGMGCRNVAKVFLPEGADVTKILQRADSRWASALEHNKYMNNHDYIRSIYLLNLEPHLDNGFLILRESTDLVSPTGVIFYEYYKEEAEVKHLLSGQKEKIQCIVSDSFDYPGVIPFGKAQQPGLWDYPDGVDVMKFLLSL